MSASFFLPRRSGVGSHVAQGFAFDLVVMFAQLSALDDGLAQKAPVIVLAERDGLFRAQTLSGGRAAVLAVPFTKDALVACVHRLIGAYVQPW